MTLQAVILVGGLGTRLGDKVRERPKPLLDIAGAPFLFHLIRNIARFGFRDIVLLAGYRSEVVRNMIAGSGLDADLGVRIRIVTEPEPLGTGGALRHALPALSENFLLLNGDSLFDFNLLDLVTAPMHGRWLARLALRAVPDATRFGVVDLAANGQIRQMQERADEPGPGVINGGVYWMRRALVEEMEPGRRSLEADVFPFAVARGLLQGIIYDGFFIDVGVPTAFTEAERMLPFVLRRPAVFFDRDGVLNRDSGYTHRTDQFAWIDGARDAVRRVNDAGWFAFVVSNQAGVARGLYDEAAVMRLHAWMNVNLRIDGAHVDAFRYCPHHPDGTIAGYDRMCLCRKPAPGMIDDLLKTWPVDAARSFLIGDKPSDVEAAHAAGISAILFGGGNLDVVMAAELKAPHAEHVVVPV